MKDILFSCCLDSQLLLQLQSSDSAVRGRAEELLKASPVEQVLPALAVAAASGEHEASNRQLAAVLVRRYAHSKLKDVPLSPEQKQQFVNQVLHSLMGTLSPESPMIVRKAGAEAIGELWRHLGAFGEESTIGHSLVIRYSCGQHDLMYLNVYEYKCRPTVGVVECRLPVCGGGVATWPHGVPWLPHSRSARAILNMAGFSSIALW